MNTDVFNRDVDSWRSNVLRKTRSAVLRMCVSGRGPGYKDQKSDTKKYNGEATKIIFRFPLYMVFVHKGAGRGYGGSKTGLFTRNNGTKGITAKSSMGKMGTGKRVAKPWFNPVLEAEFPALADIVSEYKGVVITDKLQKILID